MGIPAHRQPRTQPTQDQYLDTIPTVRTHHRRPPNHLAAQPRRPQRLRRTRRPRQGTRRRHTRTPHVAVSPPRQNHHAGDRGVRRPHGSHEPHPAPSRPHPRHRPSERLWLRPAHPRPTRLSPMADIPGAKPVPLSQLTRAQDRLTFVYLEHCIVHRDANAITAQDARGTVHIPAATLGALLLGPGTTVSQHAMVLLAESGSTAVWVGEHGVRYYAHGRTLTQSARLLERQAALVSNQSSRLRV